MIIGELGPDELNPNFLPVKVWILGIETKGPASTTGAFAEGAFGGSGSNCTKATYANCSFAG